MAKEVNSNHLKFKEKIQASQMKDFVQQMNSTFESKSDLNVKINSNSFRIPYSVLTSETAEVEYEVDDGNNELELKFNWQMSPESMRSIKSNQTE